MKTKYDALEALADAVESGSGEDGMYRLCTTPPTVLGLISDLRSMVLGLQAASNYIDTLGGDSKSYRAALARIQGGAG